MNAKQAGIFSLVTLPIILGSAVAQEIPKSSGPFAPGASVNVGDSGKLVETGILNKIAYSAYYSDGSASFSGGENRTLDYSDDWSVGCTKDSMTDAKACQLHRKNLWIFIPAKGSPLVSVGSDHFPGSSVSVRLGADAPITSSSPNGYFSAKQSTAIISKLQRSDKISTRYMEWPHNYYADETWAIYGFNEAFQYAKWAVKNIR
ncbi:hypothetical protein [Janthinobacterium sp. HLX7-2]|uniref:hypothetical protein n=1 Tax=Janthinobacterium sp. HLX7-2 TaxID=1259331 RepID=UPI003F23807E